MDNRLAYVIGAVLALLTEIFLGMANYYLAIPLFLLTLFVSYSRFRMAAGACIVFLFGMLVFAVLFDFAGVGLSFLFLALTALARYAGFVRINVSQKH